MAAQTVRELQSSVGPIPMELSVHVQLGKKLERSTKNGDPYYELHFVDGSGVLKLRVWNSTPMFPTCGQLVEKQFYEVTGQFGRGNDGKSVDSRQWTVRALNEDEVATMLQGTGELREKQDKDYAFITNTVGEVKDPRLAALGELFIKKFGKRMQRTAAARDYHHARRGGLVEHVAQMMRSAVKISEAYPLLNQDLLVIGVLFHDVGKLWENAYQETGFTMPYTEVSELLGHIPMGMEIVNKLWRELSEDHSVSDKWRLLEPSNERVRLHLLHLIASHHGELAFGSPVVPKTPEAQALHYIDNLDAKMEMFEAGYPVADELGKNVYQRIHPLPGKLVRPLEGFQSIADLEEAATEAESEPENQNESESPSDLPIPEPTSEELSSEPF
ncbi:MAG: HD domain-containing protein [Verrucomicrobiota bacterium]